MKKMTIRFLLASISLILLIACPSNAPYAQSGNKKSAAEFLDAIYGCNPEKIDSLASDSIVVSYPIFQKLFDSPVIKGKEAVKKFASGFCKRWSNPQITIHEIIEEHDIVVLVWSYTASSKDENTEVEQVSGWGGITYYRFNEKGEITEEVGEESTPGPFGRLK